MNCNHSLKGNILSFFKKDKIEGKLPKAPDWAENHPAWLRLEDQLGFYDSKSVRCQRWYKWLKTLQVLLAVAIPIFSHLDPVIAKWTTSIAGGLIAVLEGVQHMNQYSTLWVTYRSTAEHLKHEKYLFLSGAAAYRGLTREDSLVLLAERVEERVSTEHANWFNEMCRVAAEKRGGEK